MIFHVGDRVKLKDNLSPITYGCMAEDGFYKGSHYIIERVRHVPYQVSSCWGVCNAHNVLYLIGRPDDRFYYVDEKFEYAIVGFIIE